MRLRQINIVGRQTLRRNGIVQIGMLIGLWAIGARIAQLTHLPVPGGLVGLALLLTLLASRRISVASLRRGANWLLAEMLLFFIPAILAVLNHPEFWGWLGLKILAVILVGTGTVMVVTALTVEWYCRIKGAL